jgi:hypothetical protein
VTDDPDTVTSGHGETIRSDGLVETRTRSFDQGIDALRSVLPGGHGPLDAACDRLVSSLAGQFEDDVTVVLARIPASPA